MTVPEIVGCGVFDSKIAFPGITETLPRRVTNYEIEYYPEDGKVSYIDGKEYSVEKGTVIVAKPGQIRYSLLHMKSLYVWISPDDSDVCRLLSSLPDVLSTMNFREYEHTFSEIRRCRENGGDGSLYLVCALLLELVFYVNRDARLANRSRKLSPAEKASCGGILKASDYIDSNFHKKLNLEDVAKIANLSPIYFHKLFSAVMGKTPHDYLLDKRLSFAKDLLVSANIPVSAVAYESGFGSQSYFNAVFKQKVGLTPGDYRRDRLSYLAKLSKGTE